MLIRGAPDTGGSVRVSVVIVNWNGRHHLEACLGSLFQQTMAGYEVILVDNGSHDGSAAYVAASFPQVRLVNLAENMGFATGNNRGIEQACGEYIVTLNNDTRVAPDWLETLVDVADRYPQAGMVGCRICGFDDSDVIDSLGLKICSDGMSRGSFRNRRWSSLRLEEVEEILLPSACAALYKRAMLDETGYFDDDFFAYAEDTDLGLRGRLAGWDAVLATEAVVYHKYSQTAGRLSSFKVRLVERNHFWMVLKTFPLRFVIALPVTTTVRWFEQWRSIRRKQGTGAEALQQGSAWPMILATLQGAGEALAGSPGMLRKRRYIMRRRKVTSQALSALLQRYHLSFRELLDQVTPTGGD
ncbi:glycosyl transferase family 2 [Desulfurispirillum indicum S5]|uniref:Glycosyl transferase family 2 n=1 Tax=Desulfurispirillum indicum (strain ATCC BAA-1389 / DSM 22839 / S5) TaxID=653733 RepID=E6W5A5_DESIS|nr:glycosyl transferase family 2 [Desulfurispirillum indicum S5]